MGTDGSAIHPDPVLSPLRGLFFLASIPRGSRPGLNSDAAPRLTSPVISRRQWFADSSQVVHLTEFRMSQTF
jgi:hypothetical protein